MFNKFTEEEDRYYLKYICCPREAVYGYVEKVYLLIIINIMKVMKINILS
jgi:hypothetical protein